jgi:hypothetical protein
VPTDQSQFSSCVNKEPLSKLEDNGSASVLNYNLPNSTCLNSSSKMVLQIPKNKFKSVYCTEPDTHYWLETESLSLDEVSERVLSDGSLIQNHKSIQKVFLDDLISKRKGQTIEEFTYFDGQAGKEYPYSSSYIIDMIRKGYMPVSRMRPSKIPYIDFYKKPENPDPKISLILHFKTCSYLGDYGAGKTLKTFSLLPGEKTTISIRHYMNTEQTRKESKSILESSESSVLEDLQNTVEKYEQVNSSLSDSLTTHNDVQGNASGTIGIDLTALVGFPLGIGGSGGGGISSGVSNTLNAGISGQVSKLTNSISHHVSKTDSKKEIQVNSESSTKTVVENEEITIRFLENINKSRVLNFVFRQLQQEYFSITYLDDITFCFGNGYPANEKRATLSQLDGFLAEVLDAADGGTYINEVKGMIVRYLCSILDYQGTLQQFIECVDEEITSGLTCSCLAALDPITFCYLRKKSDLSQTYQGKTVKGIIVDVTHRIINTPSLISEALLGQGEALDCYNMNLQSAGVTNAHLNNDKLAQAIAIIEGITDPNDKATLYKKVFSDCCDVPQSGCGCNGNSTPPSNP